MLASTMMQKLILLAHSKTVLSLKPLADWLRDLSLSTVAFSTAPKHAFG